MRAPCRISGQQKSKWIREENDEGWEAKIGRDNVSPKFQDHHIVNAGIVQQRGRENRDIVHGVVRNAVIQGNKIKSTISNTWDSSLKSLSGPKEDKLY